LKCLSSLASIDYQIAIFGQLTIASSTLPIVPEKPARFSRYPLTQLTLKEGSFGAAIGPKLPVRNYARGTALKVSWWRGQKAWSRFAGTNAGIALTKPFPSRRRVA
jgi:hypothetical protein